MLNKKRIIIVGHSGAGKGVLAQAIAKKLNWKFIDSDFSLAPSIGRTLPEIIGSQGEVLFNNCLTEILSNQLRKEEVVITTDDSIICNEKSRDLLSSEFTVYLKVSVQVQLDRISHNRPLLPVDDYESFLNTLRTERDSLYSDVASFSISSDNGEIDEHVESILAAFKYK